MSIPAVRKEVTVPVPVEKAFAMFTERIGEWWPLPSHSIGAERAIDAVFESRLGGRLYERLDDGTEHDWGAVLVWEPPGRFVITWHVGRPPEVHTEVEVRFEPKGDGGTGVSLEHRNWERLGTGAAELRAGYDGGWDTVLGHYTDLAGSSAQEPTNSRS